jgi:hypothetical protein
VAEYWGARAYRFSGGPSGEGTRYVRADYGDVHFSGPAGEGNETTIEEIYQQVMNQHPEDISVLADQWINAYNLLASIRQQLLDQSTTLYNEHWRSAEARDAFMRVGPGETLAYLDEWMDAASNNVSALRAMVTIAENSREQMRHMWNRYKDAIAAAEDISVGDWFRSARHASWWFGSWDGSDGTREEAIQQVNDARAQFNREAQGLAERVGDEYMAYFGTISSGHGPLFYEMDAVLNAPGHEPPPRLGNLPTMSTAPGALPPLAPTVLPVPVAPPASGAPPRLIGRLAPAAPPARPGGVPAPAGALPPLPGAVPPMPGGAAAPASAGAPAAPPGASGLGSARELTSPPGPGLRDGVIQGRGAPALPPGSAAHPGGRPGAPAPPGARAPGTPAPPPGKTIGRTPGASPGSPTSPREARPTSGPRPVEVEDAFARPPTNTAPPVLSGQKPGQRQSSPLAPPAGAGQPDTPVPGRPNAAPPVLHRPTTGATRRDPLTPAASPGRGRVDRATGRPPIPGGDWLAADAARADATAPVLDAPDRPPPGRPVSKLEEVPKRLRGQPAKATPAKPGAGRGTVPPELAARRARPDAAVPAGRRGTRETRRDDRRDEAAKIVIDEDVFGVETPGGGVVGKQPKDRPFRQEPPPAISGG